MNDDKTIIDKSMAHNAAIVSANELAAICDKLQDERNNLAAQNVMLRDCLSKRDTTLERAIKYFDAAGSAFNYTGKDVSFRLEKLFKEKS